MASKQALLKAVKNYEEMVDVLHSMVAPLVQVKEAKDKLAAAIKQGYKDVSLLSVFIEEHVSE